MENVTTVLREQHAGIRRAFVRAALPGPADRVRDLAARLGDSRRGS